MQRQYKVTYYHHSGFTVSCDDTIAVFDYWEGGADAPIPPEKRLTVENLKAYRHVYVFTTHTHHDHMDPVIYTWEKQLPICYITSFDTPVGTRGRRMTPGDTMPLHENVSVKASASTDTGVSYLLNLYGASIFHAGDLNLWHWRDESGLREIEAAEKAFEEAMMPITNEKVDIAMFPVDPRQGSMFDAGANHFILSVKPKVMIPMHWQRRPEVAIEFARRAANKTTAIYALTRPMESISATFTEDSLTVEALYQTKEAIDVQKEEVKEIPERKITFFTGDDPFLDSDMPIEMQDDAKGAKD